MPTPEQLNKINLIWTDLLSGAITPDEARKLLPGLDFPAGSIDGFLESAALNRKQGLASGATWAQLPTKPSGSVSGPIQLGPKYDAQGNLVANQGPRPEEIESFGAYQRGLAATGRNAGIGGGEFGDYLQGRFAPTLATFLGQRALRGPLPLGEKEPEDAFQQYSQQFGGGDLGLQSQGIIEGLMNKLRGGDMSKLGAGDPLRAFLTPNDEQMGQVANLVRESARSRLGGVASRYLLPSNADMLQSFRAGPTGAQNTDLLPYLLRAFRM